MSTTIRHCHGCGCQTPHRHLHDTAHGIMGTHMQGSERFVCGSCGHTTFATSDEAFRFPFILDATERRSAFSHAMVRP